MQTLYFHIGQFKTGSTSIQNFLELNQDILKTQGYLYPTPSWQTNMLTLRLFECFYQGKNPFCCQDVSALLKEMLSTRLNLIYSSEYLGSFTNHIEKLKGLFSFPQYKIIIYLRRADYYFESLFNQMVRMYPITTHEAIEDFITLFNKTEANRYRVIEKWAKVFGKNNIHISIFDANNKQENILQDFCSMVGIEITENIQLPQYKSNVSLPIKIINFLKEINSKFSHEPKKNNFIKYAVSEAIQQKGFKYFKNQRKFLTITQRELIIKESIFFDNKIAKDYLNKDQLFDYKIKENEDTDLCLSASEAKEMITLILEHMFDEKNKK